jgi:glutathionylspermidine synthase
MEYYKKVYEAFEDNLNLLDEYPYKFGFETVIREEKEPHCNCCGVYTLHGMKITSTVKAGCGLDKPTLLDADGNCKFCEHHVLWKKPCWDKRTKRGRRSTQ